MLTRKLCGTEHGTLHCDGRTCGQCVHWESVDGTISDGRCALRARPECPKTIIVYQRTVCRWYEHDPAARPSWTIEAKK